MNTLLTGKLSRVDLSGADLATGKVVTIKEGFPDGAVAVGKAP